MIQVTPEAAAHLADVRKARGLDGGDGVRFVPTPGGVGMTFSKQPEPGDSIIVTKEIDVYVAFGLAPKLEGSTIDVDATDDEKRLIVRHARGVRPPA